MLNRGYLVALISCLTMGCAAVLLISLLYEPRFSWSPTLMIAVMGGFVFVADRFIFQMLFKYAPDFAWLSAFSSKMLLEREGNRSGMSIRTGFMYANSGDPWNGKVFDSLNEMVLEYNAERDLAGCPVEGREGEDLSNAELPPWRTRRVTHKVFDVKIFETATIAGQLPDSSLASFKKQADKSRRELLEIISEQWKKSQTEHEARLAAMAKDGLPALTLPMKSFEAISEPMFGSYFGYVHVPVDHDPFKPQFFRVQRKPRHPADGFKQIRVQVIPFPDRGLPSTRSGAKIRRRKMASGPSKPLQHGTENGTGSGTDGD